MFICISSLWMSARWHCTKAEVVNSLHRSYQMVIVSSYYWTNSSKIIHWIKNDIYVFIFSFLFAVLQEKLRLTINAWDDPTFHLHRSSNEWLSYSLLIQKFSLSWTCSASVNHYKRCAWNFLVLSSTLQISMPFARIDLMSSYSLLFLYS